MDREDAKHLITTCVAESDIDVKATRFPKAEVLGDIFSLAVNTRDDRRGNSRADNTIIFPSSLPQIEAVEKRYGARKLATNAMDFDDLLVLWLKLLREHADVREHYQRRFQFVLVDEYQDTNRLQSDLIDLLAARNHNVMVVGDDAQSIYAWRGANFQNILKFPERYPGREDLQDRDQLSQHAGNPERRQRRHYGQHSAVCEASHAGAQIRHETGAGGLRGRRRAGGVRGAAGSGIARGGHRTEQHGGAVSLAFSRAGTAVGTDAAEYSVQHHERHPFF